MHTQSTFSIALTLISLLIAGQVLVRGEENVEETEIKPLTFENDICSLYDNSKLIDSMLFERKYKPLVVIIAEKFIDGINRVRNSSESKRILNDFWIKNNPYYSQLHEALKNIHLYQANDTYYFVYPVDFQDHFLTVYSQRKLLDNNLGITFDFVNVKKESPFYEDILIPLEPRCTNCPLARYIGEKLQKGESFSELFELRNQLFREKEGKNFSSTTVNDYDICDSIGFNINSQSMTSLLHFNSRLKQIQNNNVSVERSKKRSTVEKNLICFQSRNLDVMNFEINEHYLIGLIIANDYLNLINNTVSSLKSNDSSFGNLCENKHKIRILNLFCFMTEISDVTSHNIPAWTDALKKIVTKPLSSILELFNSLIDLYKNEYTISENEIFFTLDYLKREMLNATENLRYVMTAVYALVDNSLRVNNHFDYNIEYTSICTIYNHWEIIDALLFEVKFKRLVIIVTESMREGIRTVNQIRARRLVPKVRREDLHYSEQFLYDFIIKHIYLVQSNDTHYYVYPTIDDRNNNSLIVYFEYKMISDYSKVVFYFVNFKRYFSLDAQARPYNSLVISALPDNCDISSGKCKTHFINPSYLIELHQNFENHFPQYSPLYVSLYNKLTEFINSHVSYPNNSDYIKYSKEFYKFLKQQQIFYNAFYLFRGMPCISSRKLNNRIDLDFSITEFNDVFYFYELQAYAHENIISINYKDNTNLYPLCSNKHFYKFLKFFCFLKINYIEDMLKVIAEKFDVFSYMKSIVENEKNDITEYLIKTKGWIEKLFLMRYIDYKYNESRMFKESDALYSQIPKITLNGADLSNKIYSIVKNNTIFLQCEKLGFVATNETASNGDNSSTENYLILSESKTSTQFQETVINKKEEISPCLEPPDSKF
ncbi:uncharacterized protein LOC122510640 [Leptopilina heterotoma]|uniref:uncharacterized protein LOC122510640 n=1 Tax=Leptopilina heterotoma TaxID=63436 RepID=UPI001CA95380|nr:uncharacterized protein LOC122510640 [Leptopilina heterotoma]